MASMFSAFDPEAYKKYQPEMIRGTFGQGQGMQSDGNLMNIIKLIQKLTSQGKTISPEIASRSGMSGMQSMENTNPILANFE